MCYLSFWDYEIHIWVSSRQRFSEDFFFDMPKKFLKSHGPGTEMTFIAVEKLVSIVFRHVMFCVTQAVTSLKIGQNL